MKLTHWLLAGMFATASVYAQDASAQNIEMRYSSLYGKLKQNVKEGHDDVRIAFFLLNQENGNVCTIHKGSMRKEKHYEELVIPENNELVVPVDSNLRQANPDVTFVIDDGITCDLSMQVIANKDYGQSINQAEVAALTPQMDNLLSGLGGMFSNWFMPEVGGVVVHFANDVSEPVRLSNGKTITVKDSKVVIKLADLTEGEEIQFPQRAVKVTPWIPQES
ncbi:DUF2987 domain-containing protein [Photobacterium chitinilyticum]|uniref:DUF2987 domain-containing protein n=1 Tax=Photobacterium chitinilyticum TaxID=2485123 RepID=A0A444JW71_9GAMM|nr:DUF2987 domain-containing protein [Photobacterium chitinilyticum]RWX57306.1 DUF2987 domain-containing protein [Photobacterium chitinilyticum]